MFNIFIELFLFLDNNRKIKRAFSTDNYSAEDCYYQISRSGSGNYSLSRKRSTNQTKTRIAALSGEY